MALTRNELERLLRDLDAAIPALMNQYPDPAQFNPALAALSDAIMDNAGIEDDVWVFEQIDGILERHGIWRPVQGE